MFGTSLHLALERHTMKNVFPRNAFCIYLTQPITRFAKDRS
jgi:hypothetical protein